MLCQTEIARQAYSVHEKCFNGLPLLLDGAETKHDSIARCAEFGRAQLLKDRPPLARRDRC